MTTLFYVGICVIVWLLSGLIVGLKFIYVDRKFNEEFFERVAEKKGLDKNEEAYYLITKNKRNFLVACMLAGLIALFADIAGSFKGGNKDD